MAPMIICWVMQGAKVVGEMVWVCPECSANLENQPVPAPMKKESMGGHPCFSA